MNDVKEMVVEYDELSFMHEKYSSFINKLRGEQMLIKQMLEEIRTWKSGKAKDAYLGMVEEYFREYSQKLAHLEDINADVNKAKMNLNSLIYHEMNKGPKI